MSKPRSRFKRATSDLANLTGFPLFVTMRDTGKPIPMAVGIRKQVMPAVPHGMRRRASGALHLLTTSKRYLLAVAEIDARRFDAQGAPAGTVAAHDRMRAIETLRQRGIHAAPANLVALPGDDRLIEEGAYI